MAQQTIVNAITMIEKYVLYKTLEIDGWEDVGQRHLWHVEGCPTVRRGTHAAHQKAHVNDLNEWPVAGQYHECVKR